MLTPKVKEYFLNGEVWFITFRGKVGNARQQTINFMIDHLRKISATFFVVRECDKTPGLFHFHSLVKILRKPSKGWFLKGCHIHVSRLYVPSVKGLVPKTSAGDIELLNDIYHETPDKLEEELAEAHANDTAYAIETINLRMFNRPQRVDRVLNYMQKELKQPERYINYAMFRHGHTYDPIVPPQPKKSDMRGVH